MIARQVIVDLIEAFREVVFEVSLLSGTPCTCFCERDRLGMWNHNHEVD